MKGRGSAGKAGAGGVVIDPDLLPVPNAEQARVISAIVSGGGVDPRRCTIVRALAGAGKTTTIDHIHVGLLMSGRTVVRLAFNRAVARDRANAAAVTLHGLIYRNTAFDRSRLERAPSPGWAVRRFGIAGHRLGHRGGQATILSAEQVAAYAIASAQRWMTTTSEALGPEHLVLGEIPPGVDAESLHDLKASVLTYASLIADDMLDIRSHAPITHDTYLRWWWQRGGRIAADVSILDEAQDASSLMIDLLLRSTETILVGDPYQGIYGWRNAVADFHDPRIVPSLASRDLARYDLVHSFRFSSSRVVDWGNSALAAIGADIRLARADPVDRPMPERPSEVVLARTRAGVLAAADHFQGRGRSVLVPAAVGLAKAFADVQALRHGVPRGRFVLFSGWRDFEVLAEADPQSEYAGWVRLFQRLGEDRIATMMEQWRARSDDVGEDGRAHDGSALVITTVHQAKGLEWDCVRLIDDWPQGDLASWDDEHKRLWYVAVTRARHRLRFSPSLLDKVRM